MCLQPTFRGHPFEAARLSAPQETPQASPIRAATVRSCEEIKTDQKREFSTDGGLTRGPTTRSGGLPDGFVSPHAFGFWNLGNSSHLLTVAARIRGSDFPRLWWAAAHEQAAFRYVA